MPSSNAAAGLGVNKSQAQAAIDQARNQVASVEIARLRESIGEAEQAEQWHDAVAAYDEVLGIDANVVFALEGRDYASRRALLDGLLTESVANPFRFNEDPVYQQVLDIYYTGRSIESPGPKLIGPARRTRSPARRFPDTRRGEFCLRQANPGKRFAGRRTRRF